MIDYPLDKCNHNKYFNDRCIDCEIVWNEAGLKSSRESVEKYANRLNELYKEKQSETD